LNIQDNWFCFKIIPNSRTYLTTGESEDGGIKPTELNPYKADEDNNFQLSILKQLIESGKRVQFVPLFREVNNYISATSAFLRGKIFFRVERTDELLNYLREKEAII